MDDNAWDRWDLAGGPPAPEEEHAYLAAAEDQGMAGDPAAYLDLMADIGAGVNRALIDLPAALERMAATLSDTAALDVIAWAQDQRRILSELEGQATTYAAQNLTAIGRTGTMKDGRRYEVKRGSNRKGWDHTGWQHDVRQAVVTSHLGDAAGLVTLDPATGETSELTPMLYAVATEVQAAHGSTSPKVTTLKALGLDPEDYCETTPGPWGVSFIDPDPANS